MATLRKSSRSSAVAIPWATAQDARLSFTAIGVLTRCLSLPPGWEFSAKRLARSCDVQGEAAVLNALKELETYGYRRVVVERGDGGRFTTWVEFSEVPVDEWIAEAAEAAARKANGKRPGPAKGAHVAPPKQKKPQVAPELASPRPGAPVPDHADETAGRAGTGPTASRSAEFLRESLETEGPHTPAAPAPPAPSVCEEPASEPEGLRAEVGWDVTPEQIAVGGSVLRATVHPEAIHLIGEADWDRLAAKCGALLARGWSRQLVERVLNRRTNAQTVAPVAVLERALNDAIKQSLTSAPHRVGLEQVDRVKAARPTRAKLERALAAADRLYGDEREFAAVTHWLHTANGADVDRWLAEHASEAAAAPLPIANPHTGAVEFVPRQDAPAAS